MRTAYERRGRLNRKNSIGRIIGNVTKPCNTEGGEPLVVPLITITQGAVGVELFTDDRLQWAR